MCRDGNRSTNRVLKGSQMTDLKVYLIGFIGTQDFRTVRAKSIKEAKNLFAQHNGIQVSSYIVAHKWTAENWNKCLSDNRGSISA